MRDLADDLARYIDDIAEAVTAGDVVTIGRRSRARRRVRQFTAAVAATTLIAATVGVIAARDDHGHKRVDVVAPTTAVGSPRPVPPKVSPVPVFKQRWNLASPLYLEPSHLP